MKEVEDVVIGLRSILRSKSVYRRFNKEMLIDYCRVRCKLFNV